MRVDYPRAAHDGFRRYVPSFKQFLALAGVGFLALVALLGVAYAATPIPQPNDMISAQTTIVYYDDGKTEIGRFGDQNRIIIPLDQVPDHVQKAVLAAEDRSFYENRGISPTGIARAFWTNLRGGATQGGSTITQQYAKNAYLSSERTYTRKFKEFFIAVKLARRDDKNKILADYLNTIYFGRRAYGIQTAAQTYFGVDAKDLTVEQGAVLASVIRSPAGYDPDEPRRPAGRPVQLRAGRDGRQGVAQGGRPRRHDGAAARSSRQAQGWLELLPDGHRAPRAQGARLHRPGHRPRWLAGDHHVRPTVPARRRARGAPGAAPGERPQRAHRAVRRAARHRGGRRDVRRWHRRRSQRGHPGAGATGLRVQAVRPGRRAARRHRAQEPLRRQLAARHPRHGQAGQQRVRPRLRDVRRPGQGDRAVDQHGVRRPDPGHGRAQGRRCGRGRRHPRGHPWPGVQRRQHPWHGVGPQHRHVHGLRDLRGQGQGGHVVHRAGGEGRQRRHPVRGAPAHDPGLRRGRRVRRELRVAAGREERHRHRGAVAGPPGGRQDGHGRAPAGHHHLRLVRRLHPAAVGSRRLLQGDRQGRPRRRRRAVHVLRR